jgi:hypothetical protein
MITQLGTLASYKGFSPFLCFWIGSCYAAQVAGLKLLGSSNPPSSAFQVGEITGIHHVCYFLFVFSGIHSYMNKSMY